MAYQSPNSVIVFGEAMIELSEVQNTTACLGVAGDTFNTAVYLARLGIDVQYVTALGDDPFSARIVTSLQAENIDTSSVIIIPNKTPGLYAIDLDAYGERTFTYWRSDSAAKQFFNTLGAGKIIKDMTNAKTLYLSGITLSIFDEASRTEITKLLKTIHSAGRQVVFDTNYRVSGWKSKATAISAIEAIMPFVTIALPTWEDEKQLFGDDNVEACAARWHAAGAHEVIIKAGQRGAFSVETGWVAPPRELKPIDTTGAGDSFNGAYLAARLSGASIKQAIMKGHELATKVIMTNGAIL